MDDASDEANGADEIPEAIDSESAGYDLASHSDLNWDEFSPRADDETANDIHRSRRGRRRIVSAVSLAVLVTVAGVTYSVDSSKNADAAIIDAVTSAIGSKTALVGITENVSTSSGVISISGTGAFDFTDHAFQMDVGGVIDSRHVVINAIYLNGTIFEQIPGISQIAPNKSWVSMDFSFLSKLSQPTGTSALGGNPLATIYALTQSGASVTDLGSSLINGQSVEGYRVSFPASMLQSEANNTHFPAWMQGAVKSTSFKSATETVYLGGGELVRLDMNVAVGTATSGPVSVKEDLDFNNYGTPVSITAPPATQVITLNQILQLAHSATNL